MNYAIVLYSSSVRSWISALSSLILSIYIFTLTMRSLYFISFFMDLCYVPRERARLYFCSALCDFFSALSLDFTAYLMAFLNLYFIIAENNFFLCITIYAGNNLYILRKVLLIYRARPNKNGLRLKALLDLRNNLMFQCAVRASTWPISIWTDSDSITIRREELVYKNGNFLSNNLPSLCMIVQQFAKEPKTVNHCIKRFLETRATIIYRVLIIQGLGSHRNSEGGVFSDIV